MKVHWLVHKTTNYKFRIESLTTYIKTINRYSKKTVYDRMCKSGCRNYNRIFSCPPYCLLFINLKNKYEYAFIIYFKINLKDYPKIYNTIRMVNSVSKSKQRKLLNNISNQLIEKNYAFYMLENGSSRLCRMCNVLTNKACKHPEKKRFSLEATGVDVNDLIQKCFNFNLMWYRKEYFPEYHGTFSCVLLNNKVEFNMENLLTV